MIFSKKSLLVLGCLSSLIGQDANATFSIVAVDKTSKQVGGAFASCTAFLQKDLEDKLFSTVPGQGAVIGQSYFFDNKKDVMTALIKANPSLYTPKRIITKLKDGNSASPTPENLYLFFERTSIPDVVGQALLQRRQYGLVSTYGAAGFTGNSNEVGVGVPLHRLDRQGSSLDGRYLASMQGNTLTEDAVITRMQTSIIFGSQDVISVLRNRFNIRLSDPAVIAKVRKNDLAEKIFLSMVAGGDNRQGDSRCQVQGVSANQGFMRVDNPNGSKFMRLKYLCPNALGPCEDALKKLAEQYVFCRVLGTAQYCLK